MTVSARTNKIARMPVLMFYFLELPDECCRFPIKIYHDELIYYCGLGGQGATSAIDSQGYGCKNKVNASVRASKVRG